MLKSGVCLTATVMPGVTQAATADERTDIAIYRLADELSDALTRYRGGRWYVEIHAASMSEYPIRFIRDLSETRDPSS